MSNPTHTEASPRGGESKSKKVVRLGSTQAIHNALKREIRRVKAGESNLEKLKIWVYVFQELFRQAQILEEKHPDYSHEIRYEDELPPYDGVS